MGAYLTLHRYDNNKNEGSPIKNEKSPLLAIPAVAGQR